MSGKFKIKPVSESSGSPRLTSIGYADVVWDGKQEQKDKVAAHLSATGWIPDTRVSVEVDWFYNNLGIDDVFFRSRTVEEMAHFILQVYGAKVQTGADGPPRVQLKQETDDGAVYIFSSQPGISGEDSMNSEKCIDAYLERRDHRYRVETYRSEDTLNVTSSARTKLRCYFVEKCEFNVDPNDTPRHETDLNVVGNRSFLERATEGTMSMYAAVMEHAVKRSGLIITRLPGEGDEIRLIVAHRATAGSVFSSLSDLYHFYDLYSTKKYVESFANGVIIMSLYLRRAGNRKDAPPLEAAVDGVVKDLSLLACAPTRTFRPEFLKGVYSLQEVVYAHVASIFVQHWVERFGDDFDALSDALGSDNTALLEKIKYRMSTEITIGFIHDTLRRYPKLVKSFYASFAGDFMTDSAAGLQDRVPLRSSSMDLLSKVDSINTVEETVLKEVRDQEELKVFRALLHFNRAILKTNFFQPTKVAISFRLNPSFLPKSQYPMRPHGLIFVVGRFFRGFHVRFEDVARGGIRLVRSRDRESYIRNCRTLFDENYGLAATQQRKNKDIPEGGAKGTILLDVDHQDRRHQKAAFKMYIDSILDLLLEGQSPGIKEKIVDKLQQPEILFFGPDEGTADLMDWASQHAKKRGLPSWKALTTGKSPKFGGIPHDIYGMTTNSVHTYVLGIMEKKGWNESECTKFQTGGPDGDLGSNEIKISKDRTTAIVDGSGVLYDPKGINRDELVRLAKARLMISHFNVDLLSEDGFRVLCEDRDIVLPNGVQVANGTIFRNMFHLDSLSSADVFVPCGGRPEAVDINNVHRLYNEDGTPRFAAIVEGANLFFTQQARQHLEASGVILFKDASANKGGVTSSSLEVLAGLAFTDEEWATEMACSGDEPPAFYQAYVAEVVDIICHKARLEFDCLWRAHEAEGSRPLCELTDIVSEAVISLTNDLKTSQLWSDKDLRCKVMAEALPQSLQSKLTLPVILERVPEQYLRAIFARHLATKYVYANGTEASPFAFYQFMTQYH